MIRIFTFIAAVVISLRAAMAATPSVEVSGGAHVPVSIEPERSSGLGAVFVVDSSDGSSLEATYTPINKGATVSWSRFSTLGAGFAEPLEGVTGYTLSDLTPDMGYIVTEGNRQFCFWVADYASRPFILRGVDITDSDCMSATIMPQGEGERMTYVTINGRVVEIDRDIRVNYTTLTYDTATGAYTTANASEKFTWLRPELHVKAPLTDTRFSVSGDRFLRQWGIPVEAQTQVCPAVAVDAVVNVGRLAGEKADNEMTSASPDGVLGGSAPAEVEFNAAVSDAALFTEWQFSTDPDFSAIDLRFSDPVMTFTFRESGVTYIRFYAANASGSCSYTSDTFEVNIGESDLKCPNAFSPGASEGVNDEWRVSYKSIVEFDCYIFTRSGRRVAHLTSPSQGWDGKIGGKIAPPGAYYYVIRATGSDGRHYNLSGDINIIGSR